MESLKQEIGSYIDLVAGELADINRFIYQHPEVALQKKKQR